MGTRVGAGLLLATLSVIVGAVPAAAADPLMVGIFPRRPPAETQRMFAPLAARLAERLHRPVHLESAPDFPAFWEGVAARRYDLVHYNQYHYVRSHKEHGYRVILSNEEFGDATIAASIVVRKDSGLRSLQDLKGKKIVFGGGPTAMQSYILARFLLHQAGLTEADFFSQFALNPLKACVAVYYGQAAAAGAGNRVFDLPAVKNEIDTSEMIYLAVSEPLIHLPWAVKADMPEAAANAIQSALSELSDTADGREVLAQAGLTGLRVARDADYDPHRRIIGIVLGEVY